MEKMRTSLLKSLMLWAESLSFCHLTFCLKCSWEYFQYVEKAFRLELSYGIVLYYGKGKGKCIAVCETSPTPLGEVTYHMGSHSVTCHPAEVTFLPLPQPKLVLDLASTRDARLSWPRHTGCKQFAKDCYSTASRLRFERVLFRARVRHTNHSATKPPMVRETTLQYKKNDWFSVFRHKIQNGGGDSWGLLADCIKILVPIPYSEGEGSLGKFCLL